MEAVTVKFGADELEIDGVCVSYMAIPQIIHELTHPDPRKWFRFERRENSILVHTRISQEEPDGSLIARVGDTRFSAKSSGT